MNPKKLLSYLAPLVVTVLGCTHQPPVKVSLHTSFEVDSIKIFQSDTAFSVAEDFVFSPIDPIDKIWVLGGQGMVEFNLTNGQKSNLSARYGQGFMHSISVDGIWRDTLTDELYISQYECCLMRYNALWDSFTYFDLYGITAFVATEKYILLGTVNGLYILDRGSNTIAAAENFPSDVAVKSIAKWREGTWLVNKKYRYDVKRAALKTLEVEANIKIPGKQRVYNLSASDSGISNNVYRKFKRDSLVWYFGKDELYYSTSNHVFQRFDRFPKGDTRYISEDTRYLYVMYSDKFVIINKRYLFEHSTLFKREDPHAFKSASKMTAFEESGVYFDKKDITLSVFLEEFHSMPTLLMEWGEDTRLRRELETGLKKGLLTGDCQYYALLGLAQYYNGRGNLHVALRYMDELAAAFPDKPYDCQACIYACVQKKIPSFDSLSRAGLSGDEYLMKEAALIYDFINCCSCWFGAGNGFSDYSLVDEKYEQLLREYPQSQFADDAEFWLIERNYYMSREGSEGYYPPEDIPKLKRFIDKYPLSDKVPYLIEGIAASYAAPDFNDDPQSQVRGYQRAIDELSYLLQYFSLTAEQEAQAKKQRQYYQQELADFKKEMKKQAPQ